MKTIAIDCRFASAHGGLSRYTRELTSRLVHDSAVRFVLFVRSTREDWIPKAPNVTIVKAAVRHYSAAEQVAIPMLLRAHKADLLFSPHFNVPFMCPVPFVVTIHDLILHRYPNDASFLKRVLYRKLIAHAVAHARRIVTVSPFVRGEIETVFGEAAADKTRVVTEGVDPAFHPLPHADLARVRDAFDLQKPYFLYVGNAKQHKNVPLLIEAFEKSGRTDSELILITGGKEAERLRPFPPNVRCLRDVSDADLPALYCAAEALVTASLYEGFCLPVAEALACGTPVIATDGSAIKDGATGLALLIEPSVDAFAAALRSPPPRTGPYVVGTWEHAAQETMAVLREAMDMH